PTPRPASAPATSTSTSSSCSAPHDRAEANAPPLPVRRYRVRGTARAHTFSCTVDAPLDEVFAWHARPGAIVRLMPPWLPVRVAAETASPRHGAGGARPPRRAGGGGARG